MPNDHKLMIEFKDGNLHTEVEGELTECLASLTYRACHLCRLGGRTPSARDEIRRKIVESLNDIGPMAIEALALINTVKAERGQQQ